MTTVTLTKYADEAVRDETAVRATTWHQTATDALTNRARSIGFCGTVIGDTVTVTRGYGSYAKVITHAFTDDPPGSHTWCPVCRGRAL